MGSSIDDLPSFGLELQLALMSPGSDQTLPSRPLITFLAWLNKRHQRLLADHFLKLVDTFAGCNPPPQALRNPVGGSQ
jgi:hypothetical protein